MPERRSILDYIVQLFSLVPMVLYMVVAILLTVIAVFSVFDAVQLIEAMIVSRNFTDAIVGVINSLLLTVTIIVLFETVTVYFRTKHVDVRALLVAAFTGLVRHVLVYSIAGTDPVQMLGTVALLAVLIAGIVLVKSEVPCPGAS
jgi:uncharacterized membrane protein (DUF373 family)